MISFLTLLLLGASLVVATNSSPRLISFSQPSQDEVSSDSPFAKDSRRMAPSYTVAYLKYSYTTEDSVLGEAGEIIGKYGQGRILNRTGLLVHITKSDDEHDHTGCTGDWNGTLGSPLPPRGASWIALIQRGNCYFEDKVDHAYNHGAGAVIVYNDVDDLHLDIMAINDKERDITAVFTTRARGHVLIDHMERMGYTVTMTIIEGNRFFRSLD